MLLASLFCLAASGALAAPSGRFDLICTIQGNRIGETGKSRAWRDTTRLVIDLAAMRYCEKADCPRTGPRTIVAQRDGRIFFYDQPNLKWSVRLRDGKFTEWMTDGQRENVIIGACRRARFTGLSWRVADSSARRAETTAHPDSSAPRVSQSRRAHGSRAGRRR